MTLCYLMLVGWFAASGAAFARPLENPGDDDGLSLSKRAAEPEETHLPGSIGWIALGGLVAVVLLALFSAGEREPGDPGPVAALTGGTRAHDLFLPARLVRTSGGRPAAENEKEATTVYLRDLDRRHATLVGLAPVVRGDAVTVSVGANGEAPGADFRGRVVRCRRLRGDGLWYVVKLVIVHDLPDGDGVTRLLRLVAHPPNPASAQS